MVSCDFVVCYSSNLSLAILIPDFQSRWTRREEADFYRVVSTFGVVFDPDRGQFDWTKFRAMARLHKKTDESLEKYLYAFMAMCRRVCRLPSKDGELWHFVFSFMKKTS